MIGIFFILYFLVGILQIGPRIAEEFRKNELRSIWHGIAAFFLTIALLVTWPVWAFPRKR